VVHSNSFFKYQLDAAVQTSGQSKSRVESLDSTQYLPYSSSSVHQPEKSRLEGSLKLATFPTNTPKVVANSGLGNISTEALTDVSSRLRHRTKRVRRKTQTSPSVLDTQPVVSKKVHAEGHQLYEQLLGPTGALQVCTFHIYQISSFMNICF